MLVIFDLDGTLFQTAYCDVNAVDKLFKELALPKVNEEIIIRNIGKSTTDFLRSILPPYIKENDVYDRFRELERTAVKEEGILFPGIEEMLQQLKLKGHTLYVCSTGSMEYIELVLKKTGIRQYFDKVYSAKSFPSKTAAVNEIISCNESAVIVGDTISDIEAGNKNSIPSIGVLYGYGSKEEVLKSTFTAQSVNNIVYLVKKCDLFFRIKSKLLNKSKRIIGINGVDTSGKTMFSIDFSKFLLSTGINNVILHIDDFHNPSALRRQGENEIKAYYNNAFNYKQLINEVLDPLKNQGEINKDVLCLDLDTDKYEKLIHYNIGRDTIVIIEGVLLFRTPVIDYLDGKIFLQITFDEVLRRARLRDVPKYGEGFLQKYIDKYIPIQKLYLDQWKPAEAADMVIDNEDFNAPRLYR